MTQVIGRFSPDDLEEYLLWQQQNGQNEEDIIEPELKNLMVESGNGMSQSGSFSKAVSVDGVNQLMNLKDGQVSILQKGTPVLTPGVQNFIKTAKLGAMVNQQGKLKSTDVVKRQSARLAAKAKKLKAGFKLYKQSKASNSKKYTADQPHQKMMNSLIASKKKNVALVGLGQKVTNANDIAFKDAPFGGPKGPAFPRISGYRPSTALKDYPTSQLVDILQETLFQGKKKQIAPQIWGDIVVKNKKNQNMLNYVAKISAQRANQQSSMWKNMGDDAKWVTDHWELTYKPADKRLDNFILQDTRKVYRYDLANVLMSKQMADDAIPKYVTPLVQNIVKFNPSFSNVGIGPISANGLPLYAGRWVDKATGRVRVLPTATTKYINPISYNSKLSYLEARVLNSWNKYVMAEEQYYNLAGQNKEKWEKKQQQTLKAAILGNQKNKAAAIKWMYSQIKIYKTGMPVSAASTIVLGTVDQLGKLPQLQTNVNELFKKEDKVNDTELQEFAQTLQGYATTIISQITGTTPEDMKKKLRIGKAYGTWMEKPFVKNADNIKKLAKTRLPEQLQFQEVASVDEKLTQFMQFASGKYRMKVPESTIQSMLDEGPADAPSTFYTSLDQLKTATTGGMNTFASAYAINNPPKQKKAPKYLPETVERQGLKFADI